jgi:hypothetical protein
MSGDEYKFKAHNVQDIILPSVKSTSSIIIYNILHSTVLGSYKGKVYTRKPVLLLKIPRNLHMLLEALAYLAEGLNRTLFFILNLKRP